MGFYYIRECLVVGAEIKECLIEYACNMYFIIKFNKLFFKPLFVLFPRRFYIESITLLKDNTTVELFFLNAKAAVYNVSYLLFYSALG